MEDRDLMTRRYWGIPEVARYIGLSNQTAHTYSLQKGFPKPTILIGTRIRGYERKAIVAWWQSRQKKRAG
jgi:predicted DNA-binding transcriptional regulator AlpA